MSWVWRSWVNASRGNLCLLKRFKVKSTWESSKWDTNVTADANLKPSLLYEHGAGIGTLLSIRRRSKSCCLVLSLSSDCNFLGPTSLVQLSLFSSGSLISIARCIPILHQHCCIASDSNFSRCKSNSGSVFLHSTMSLSFSKLNRSFSLRKSFIHSGDSFIYNSYLTSSTGMSRMSSIHHRRGTNGTHHRRRYRHTTRYHLLPLLLPLRCQQQLVEQLHEQLVVFLHRRHRCQKTSCYKRNISKRNIFKRVNRLQKNSKSEKEYRNSLQLCLKSNCQNFWTLLQRTKCCIWKTKSYLQSLIASTNSLTIVTRHNNNTSLRTTCVTTQHNTRQYNTTHHNTIVHEHNHMWNTPRTQ